MVNEGGVVMNKTEFGSYIKESRLKKNYTQKQLADLLFIDVSAVSKWERGISFPDITLVPDICKVLDISEHELISASSDQEYRRMKKDAKTLGNMKKGTFWTFNICYAIALLVCFIVNVAVNHTLSWFFIVAASVLCAYSFCPTFTWASKKYKTSIFLGTTFVSLFILFLTNSLYTKNYWFMVATLGTLLGYFIVFFPIIFKMQKNYLEENKYNRLSRFFLIIYLGASYMILHLLLISINFYAPYDLSLALWITNICFIFPIIFGVINIFDATRKYRKPFGIVLGSAFVILMFVSLGQSIYQVNTKEINTYTISESFSSIKFDGDADIKIYESENNTVSVSAKEYKDITFDFEVVNDILVIDLEDNRGWNEKLFNITSPYIKLYLPTNNYESLVISGDTFDTKIEGAFSFEKLSISSDTGDVFIKNVSVGECNIKSDTGDIKIYNSNLGVLKTIADTGDITLSNTIVVNDFTHKAETGDVIFKSFDAKNIYIVLDTGDVKGTLLSSKIFMIITDTGEEKVPETTTGGICKIETDTGDINISIEE